MQYCMCIISCPCMIWIWAHNRPNTLSYSGVSLSIVCAFFYLVSPACTFAQSHDDKYKHKYAYRQEQSCYQQIANDHAVFILFFFFASHQQCVQIEWHPQFAVLYLYFSRAEQCDQQKGKKCFQIKLHSRTFWFWNLCVMVRDSERDMQCLHGRRPYSQA